jgi:hypothetical protein
MGKIKCCGPEEYDWETERDLEALCRAKAVEKDPERLKKCQALAKKKLDESKRNRDMQQTMVDMGEGKTP